MKFKKFNFKKVKSTNDTAIRLIKNNICKLGMVVADNQSNGKGQYGRKWISYKGNVFLSFFYKLENINLSLNTLTKKNCFLVRDVISKYYKKKITFKPPNDLLINKKKICGILQETVVKNGKKFLIVGIGINTNLNPNNGNFSSTSLKLITNKNIDNKILFIIIKDKYEKFLSKINLLSFTKLKRLTKYL